MLDTLDALHGVVARIGSGIRQRAATAAVCACAGAVFAVSAGFAVMAGYLALAREMPSHLAALVTAAALALLGSVLLVVATVRRRRITALTSRPLQENLAYQAEELTDLVVRESIARIQRKPSSAVLTAVALGVVVGLIRRDPPR
jgi:hypothetical protein